MTHIRTRFAPSPTGFLHIGSLRTALYSYAFAKSRNGDFVLRVEDTDRKRTVPGAMEKIFEMLKVFGIEWDEGPIIGGPYDPYIQSERVKKGIYRKYAENLVSEGNAYYCFCPPETKEDIKNNQQKKVNLRDECRNLSLEEAKKKIQSGEVAAIRLRIPDNESISYRDFVLNKEIVWDTKNIDEVMLLKSDGFPTYHLAVVVDDALMGITHIIRGRDWLPSTPAHLLLYKYLGFALPQIGHLTDIQDPNGGKLSKRKGSVSCEEFLNNGYLPEAILNFIMLLGWAPKDNREIFSLAEFVHEFPKGNIHVANPVFNRKKLDWFNGYYIRQKSDREIFLMLRNFVYGKMDEDLIARLIPLVKPRITRLTEFADMTQFFVSEPKTDSAMIFSKLKEDGSKVNEYIKCALAVLQEVEKWESKDIEKRLYDMATDNGFNIGDFFMTLRIVITGRSVTPPLAESMEILGRDKVIKRITAALPLFS